MARKGKRAGHKAPARKRTPRAAPPAVADAAAEPGPGDGDQLARLLKHPAARYLLIAPTALSALANLEPIGSLAQRLVALWRPVLDSISKTLDALLPESPIPGEMLVALLFFLPFPVMRAIAMARGRDRRTPALEALLGLAAFAVLFVMVGGGGQPDTDAIVVAATFTLPVAAAYGLARLVFHLVKPLRDWTALAMPVASAVAIGTMATVVYLRGETNASPLQVLMLVAVWALPLLNPRRLLQVAALALGVIAISLAYDWLSSLAA